MTCCGNPVPVTTGITQTITGLWDHPQIALQTKPLELVKVVVTDTIIVTPAQEATVVIIMTTEIATTSQLLVIAKARFTMPFIVTALFLNLD